MNDLSIQITFHTEPDCFWSEALDVPDHFIRHPLENKDGPRVLILPFGNYVDDMPSSHEEISNFIHTPTAVTVLPVMRRCYGYPAFLHHLWQTITNIRSSFQSSFYQGVTVYKKNIFPDFGSLKEFHTNAGDFDYVVEGVFVDDDTTKFCGIRIWDSKTQECVFQKSSDEHTDSFEENLSHLVIDLTNFITNLKGAQENPGYRSYLHMLLERIKIDQLIEIYYYLFEFKFTAGGFITLKADAENIDNLLSSAYNTAEQTLDIVDFQLCFFASLLYAEKIQNNSIKKFELMAIDLSFAYNRFHKAMHPYIYAIYKKLEQNEPAEHFKRALIRQYEEMLDWLSKN